MDRLCVCVVGDPGVVPLMSLITLANWMFISVGAFCICWTQVAAPAHFHACDDRSGTYLERCPGKR